MTGPRVLPGAGTEKALARHIAELAKLFGYERYHTHRSDFSPAGYPDETLCRPPRLIIAELKSDQAWRTKNHGLSPAQQKWGRLLKACPGVEFYVWAPHQLDDIVRILR